MIGYNVYWVKKGSDLEKITFIMAENHEEAWNKVLKIKGGSNKITIIKAQEYDRLTKSLKDEPVLYHE